MYVKTEVGALLERKGKILKAKAACRSEGSALDVFINEHTIEKYTSIRRGREWKNENNFSKSSVSTQTNSIVCCVPVAVCSIGKELF